MEGFTGPCIYTATFVSGDSDLSQSSSLAVRSEDKKERRGGRAESIPPFRTCPEISNLWLRGLTLPEPLQFVCSRKLFVLPVEILDLVVARDSLIYDLVIRRVLKKKERKYIRTMEI